MATRTESGFRLRSWYFLAGLCLVLVSYIGSGCAGPDDSRPEFATETTTSVQLSVAVVNYPLMYFTQRIGGDNVELIFPVPPDVDPAYWQPGPHEIAGYQEADLIFLNGASYARWVPMVSLPESRMVDTSAAFADRYIPLQGQGSHRHGNSGEHQHGELAFTTWLDPAQAIMQAQAIRDALIRLRPGAAEEFNRGFMALESDLLELDARLSGAFSRAGEEPILFSHPVYQYLARRYGVAGQSVHWEPGEAPSPEQWETFKTMQSHQAARWMIWEGEPQAEVARELQDQGVGSLVLDPCAGRPVSGDFLTVMWDNVQNLSKAFDSGKKEEGSS